MLLRNSDLEGNYYYVTCANWESCVEAKTPEEAATIAMEEAHKEYGGKMCLSPTVSVMDMSSTQESFDLVENLHFLFAPKVLANAGLHELSKKFKSLINDASNENMQ